MGIDNLILAGGALAVVLALILLAQRAARWAGAGWGLAPRPASGGRLALVEAVALDPRRRMCLVRCDGRHVLVMTGGAQDVVVGWVDGPGAAP